MALNEPFVIEVEEKDDDYYFEKGVIAGLGIAGVVLSAAALTQTLVNKKKIDDLTDRVYDLECTYDHDVDDEPFPDYCDDYDPDDPGYEESKEETGHSDLDNALLSSSK